LSLRGTICGQGAYKRRKDKTCFRDTIGKHELADLLQNRESIAKTLQETPDGHTNPG
jgi:hypothetical protein